MKKVKNNINSIVLGLLDAILPNFKNCIKEIKSEFITDEDYIEVNWLRLFVSLITFTFLVLNFFDRHFFDRHIFHGHIINRHIFFQYIKVCTYLS